MRVADRAGEKHVARDVASACRVADERYPSVFGATDVTGGMSTVNDADFWRDVGLGKGAWQCDENGGHEIAPEDEARVFEELPTMDSPRLPRMPDVPTVPPRTDDAHVAVFFDGCRYRVKFDVRDSVMALKRALCVGGLGLGADMSTGARAKLERGAEDLVLFFRMREMVDDEASVASYGVPVGSKTMIGCDRRLVERAKAGLGPGEDDDYWA